MDGYGRELLVKIPSIGHLRYSKFKYNCKSFNLMHQFCDTFSSNMKEILSSSVVNICHYLASNYDDESIAATTTTMMSDVGLNVFQSRILIRILRY